MRFDLVVALLDPPPRDPLLQSGYDEHRCHHHRRTDRPEEQSLQAPLSHISDQHRPVQQQMPDSSHCKQHRQVRVYCLPGLFVDAEYMPAAPLGNPSYRGQI